MRGQPLSESVVVIGTLANSATPQLPVQPGFGCPGGACLLDAKLEVVGRVAGRSLGGPRTGGGPASTESAPSRPALEPNWL